MIDRYANGDDDTKFTASEQYVGPGISMLGAGVRPELCVILDRSGNLRFCLEVSNCFVIGAQPAYHGRIAMEPTGLYLAPVTGRVS